MSGGQNSYPASLTVRNLLTVAYETQANVQLPALAVFDKSLRRLRWQLGELQRRAYGTTCGTILLTVAYETHTFATASSLPPLAKGFPTRRFGSLLKC